MPRGPVNLHRRLGDDELPWRYVRRHDRVEIEEDDPTERLLVDDYWDPWYEVGALDVQLHRIWQQVVNLGFAAARAGSVSQIDPAPRRSIAPDDLAGALCEQLEQVGRAELDGPLDEVRAVSRRVPELVRWFELRRGPGLTLLVLAPFWIRSLASWPAPPTDDLDALGRSLVEHLLVRYPVPEPLYRPWRSSDPPPLKWATWLVLIGQGASLHRAAPRFGWSVPTKLAQMFTAITDDVSPIDAVMSAEITRLGGSRTELDRLRRHPGYVFDPTGSNQNDRSIDGAEPNQRPDEVRRLLDPTYQPPPEPDTTSDAFRAYWQSTVGWLARHRDELTDEGSDLILDWALHRHTEDRAFAWSGRTPAATLEHARFYRETLENSWRARVEPLFWRERGWSWEHTIDDHQWSIVELTSAMKLAEESREMQHCVASYAYRCVQGASAIFSLSRDGARRITIEIDPRSRELVQARGARNRNCDEVELGFVRRWLAEVVAKSTT